MDCGLSTVDCRRSIVDSPQKLITDNRLHMANIPLEHFLIIAAALFVIGALIIITKKNVIVVLMGIELIFNAANINLVAFSQYDPELLKGNMFALFIIVIAAAEAAVALAIILKVYHHFKTANIDEIRDLKG